MSKEEGPILHKFWKIRGKASQLILWNQFYPDIKVRQKHDKKTIDHEYRCKSCQQNINKPRLGAYKKDYTPWTKGIYPRMQN